MKDQKMTVSDRIDEFIRIPRGYSRARAISALVRELDKEPASGPAPTLSTDEPEVIEDNDLPTDASVGGSDDDSEVRIADGDGDASDSGDSSSHPNPTGEEVDEDDPEEQTDAQIETSGTDVEPPSGERIPEEDKGGSEQYGDFTFHFAPGEYRN
jgi:hypothetical protein